LSIIYTITNICYNFYFFVLYIWIILSRVL